MNEKAEVRGILGFLLTQVILPQIKARKMTVIVDNLSALFYGNSKCINGRLLNLRVVTDLGWTHFSTTH